MVRALQRYHACSRMILLVLCLCSLIVFLFAQNEHIERNIQSPLDVLHHAYSHFERENHEGTPGVSPDLWDLSHTITLRIPYFPGRLRLHSVSHAPLLPPPRHSL